MTFIAGVAMLAWSHKFWGKHRSSPGSGRENAIRLSLFSLLASKYCIICITFWDTIFAVPSPFRKDCLASSTRCLPGVSSDYGPTTWLSLHMWSLPGAQHGAWVTPEQLAIPPGTNLLLRISARNHLTAWWFLFRPAPKISSHFGSTSQVPWKKSTTLSSEST